MKTRRLVLSAMLTALYVLLSLYVTINLGNMKITLDALPILIAALLFGPLTGAAVGLVGSFLVQMLTYGFTPTTLLWILPAGVRGLLVGAAAKRLDLTKRGNLLATIVVSALIVTTINTVVMAIDAKLYGYYSHAYVFGALIWRYLAGILVSVVYAAVLPVLLSHLRRAGIGVPAPKKE